jgi:hypothetical protein
MLSVRNGFKVWKTLLVCPARTGWLQAYRREESWPDNSRPWGTGAAPDLGSICLPKQTTSRWNNWNKRIKTQLTSGWAGNLNWWGYKGFKANETSEEDLSGPNRAVAGRTALWGGGEDHQKLALQSGIKQHFFLRPSIHWKVGTHWGWKSSCTCRRLLALSPGNAALGRLGSD